jgi:hypothetical protein
MFLERLRGPHDRQCRSGNDRVGLGSDSSSAASRPAAEDDWRRQAGSRHFKGQVVSGLDVCEIPKLHSQSCQPDINLTLLSAGERRPIAATSA